MAFTFRGYRMAGDHRYEAALRAGLGIIHAFDQPWLSRQEKLAGVTYAVLDAIYRAEGLTPPDPTSLPGHTAGVRVHTDQPKRLEGGRHERSKLPAPR